MFELIATVTKDFMGRAPEALGRLGEDEDGAMEASQILIIAFVAIPLIIGLVVFGNWITEQLKTKSGEFSSTKVDKPMF